MINFLLVLGLLVGSVALTIVVINTARRRLRLLRSSRSDHLGRVSQRWLTGYRAEN
jgi:hypothetical protein